MQFIDGQFSLMDTWFLVKVFKTNTIIMILTIVSVIGAIWYGRNYIDTKKHSIQKSKKIVATSCCIMAGISFISAILIIAFG